MPEKTLLPIFLFSAFVLATARWAPRWALKRPALVLVLTVGLVAWGLISLAGLPVELMPNMASETVTVTVNVRGGMPPHDVETLITRPLEEALGDLPSLKTLFSSAKKDRGVVSLGFTPGVDMKMVTANVHERMERALPRLPPEIEKPVIAHFEESDQPVYIGAITSPRFSPEQMRRIVEDHIKDKLLRVPGVANVEIGGGRERKILIEVNRGRLLAYGLSIQRIVSILGRRNVAVQIGSLEGSQRSAPVQVVGSFKNVEEMKKVMVGKDRAGGMILLENVAEVRDSFMEAESLSRLNGLAAVSLYVQKESSANTLQVAKGLQKALGAAWRDLPPAQKKHLTRVTVSDQAVGIRAAIASVRTSLVSGVLLIVLVLCVFQGRRPFTRRLAGVVLGALLFFMTITALLNVSQAGAEIPQYLLLAVFAGLAFVMPDLRSSFIVGGSIPLSALFCFILFKMCHISLNVMSLFGLALGIGMLVDNATVVYENITRKYDTRDPKHEKTELTLEAAEEMVIPLIGATVTNAVVFVPFLFLSQEIQRLYLDVAAAVGASLFASMAVSLTLVPLLTERFALGTPETGRENARLPLLRRVLRRGGAPMEKVQAAAQAAWNRFFEGFLPRAGTFAAGALNRAGRAGAFAFTQSGPARAVSRLLGGHTTLDLSLAAAVFFAGLWVTGYQGASKALFCLAVAAAGGSGFFIFRHYTRLWEIILKLRFAVLGAALALAVGAAVLLGWGTERDFQTGGQQDEFVIFVELSSGIKLAVSDEVVKEIERLLHDTPEANACIKTLVSRVEGWSSKIYVTLKPRAQRKLTTEEVIALLRKKLENAGRAKDENAFVHFSSAQSGQEVTVQITGPDYAVLERLAQQVTGVLGKIKGLEDVKMRYRPGRPEVQLRVDPERASRHGLSAEAVAETVHAQMRGLRATLFRTQASQIETVVRLRLEDRDNLAVLLDLPIKTRGQQLLLGSVAFIEMGKMPNEVFRENKQRLIQITANRGKISLGRAADEIQKSLKQIKWPLEYFAFLAGDYEEMAQGLKQLAWGLLVMVLLVYLILVLLFESLLQPFIIMTTVPLCLIGAVWGIALLRLPLTNGVMVGMMVLGGIVVNNAIMLLDQFNSRTLGRAPSPEELSALLKEAAVSRMYPILLTAGSAVLGFLPMMLDTSESGALWRPLSVTMVFGLIVSTVLTLYVVPCITYVLMADIPALFKRIKTR